MIALEPQTAATVRKSALPASLGRRATSGSKLNYGSLVLPTESAKAATPGWCARRSQTAAHDWKPLLPDKLAMKAGFRV
jgi:hypothetical protein